LGKGAPAEEILARLAVARRITHVECSLRTSNRENRRLSMTDALTGANNRRYFTNNLPRELSRARNYGHWLAVLSCDIDRFKQINDGYGHEVGDELLRSFVARSSDCIRSTDWLARVGGDEFFLVLPETDMRGANSVAQKLRRALEGRPVLSHAGPLTFTVSIGVAATQAAFEIKSDSTIERLLSGADRGLYISKRLGGNRATCVTLDPDRVKPACAQ
jgi:diguanylate cyclase (GGDEF)-like protein